MKSRGKRTSKKYDPLVEVSQVKSGETTAHRKGTSKSLAGEGVQCEMGTEVFRRYWTPLCETIEDNESDQVITGDPIGTDPLRYITEDERDDRNATSRTGNPTTIEPGDANCGSSWKNAFSSHEMNLEKYHEATATSKEPSGVVLTNNGADTMVFPLVLNVVDESGKEEVVAVVSLDAMSPSDNLTEHEESHTGEHVQADAKPSKTYSCGDCTRVFSSIVPYEKHCLEHNCSEPFKCTRCTRRFKRRQDLDRHIVCHPEEAFSCGTCFTKFPDRDELMFHYKTHEPVPNSPKASDEPEDAEMLCKVEMFPCSQCDKTFSDADLLQHHEFTHSEGELFPCDQCGRTFREESRLGMHLKLHKKNQRCDKCEEVFTNMFDFNEHMIAHKYEDSKEDYKCVHCKVNFNSFYFLKKHAVTHGMEVHWCGDCGGSGHVGSPHDTGNTSCENPVLLDNLVKPEEDPLKLEDSSSDDLVDAHVEEVLVDEVIIKAERSSFSKEEAEILHSTIVEDKPKGKRKHSGKSGKSLREVCLKPRQKTAQAE